MYNKKELLRKDNIKMNKEINVGITIKNIRKSKKLLLKDVALKCGISSSMLSQIEKGNANPSLNTIKSIAQVLEVPLFKFFMDLEKEKYEFHLLKKDDRKIISTEYVTYELLSPDVETNIECMQMTLIGKNAETSVKPMAHKGEEIAVLLNGKVKLTIGKFSIVLSSGDSIHIPSMAPHKWTNLHTEKSVVIFSVSPPEF
ncbi:MerR family transcriptional regulator [Fusobacterium nucleatum subsp. nucleatum]|nr:MerR family transcriptional regulator [Fusobacterium nucleatum subsp. nucleatum]